MTKLLSVVLHPGKQRLEAVVEDVAGVRRHIEYTWVAKERSDLPPEGWWESVQAEVEFQRVVENEARLGRTLV